MLVLNRKGNEKIFVGEDVVINVLKVQGNRVTLGITAPSEVKIVRGELVTELPPTDEDEKRDAA